MNPACLAPTAVNPDELALEVARESDVAHVIAAATRFCRAHGLAPLLSAHVATAASELANNLWMHTLRGGSITLALRRSVRGRAIEVRSHDDGPGIADIDLALSEGYTTGGGLGYGLPGVQRLMDDFHIASRPGEGTVVIASKWEHA